METEELTTETVTEQVTESPLTEEPIVQTETVTTTVEVPEPEPLPEATEPEWVARLMSRMDGLETRLLPPEPEPEDGEEVILVEEPEPMKPKRRSFKR